MKRISALLLLVSLLLLCLCSCLSQDTLPDLSKAARIEIRVFSPTEQVYTDYTISDETAVREICDTLSSLKLKKIKLTEPLSQSFILTFYYPNGGRIGSVTLVFGHNVVDCGKTMYKIQNELDINDYVSEFIPQK